MVRTIIAEVSCALTVPVDESGRTGFGFASPMSLSDGRVPTPVDTSETSFTREVALSLGADFTTKHAGVTMSRGTHGNMVVQLCVTNASPQPSAFSP